MDCETNPLINDRTENATHRKLTYSFYCRFQFLIVDFNFLFRISIYPPRLFRFRTKKEAIILEDPRAYDIDVSVFHPVDYVYFNRRKR